ncbi:MAG TPA: transglutaminase family protein [Candidatus Sulfotelmatobacter sp.]|nr:transglutaminase family protein [Candidatus Sulfotelmatobacter sp.]
MVSEVGEGTLRIAVGCEFVCATQAPVPAVCLVRPTRHDGLRVLGERWTVEPAAAASDYVDLYGNVCRRLTLAPGTTTIRYDATVETPAAADPLRPDAVEHPVDELPDDVLTYTLPSRYCLSDVLANRACELFGAVEPGWGRVQAISDFVHGHLRFAYGSSTATTTALDVYEARTGVCRDFAHLFISFCRALNIPARYVFGYLPDIDVPPPDLPMDFCAWAEVYLGGAWATFDPRNNERRKGRVVIARGRDALDVAMLTTFGQTELVSMTVRADEESNGS